MKAYFIITRHTAFGFMAVVLMLSTGCREEDDDIKKIVGHHFVAAVPSALRQRQHFVSAAVRLKRGL